MDASEEVSRLDAIIEELLDVLVDAHTDLWHALDHLGIDDPHTTPTILRLKETIEKYGQ